MTATSPRTATMDDSLSVPCHLAPLSRFFPHAPRKSLVVAPHHLQQSFGCLLLAKVPIFEDYHLYIRLRDHLVFTRSKITSAGKVNAAAVTGDLLESFGLAWMGTHLVEGDRFLRHDGDCDGMGKSPLGIREFYVR